MCTDDIRLAARLFVPVLITAEHGDERLACARLIHTNSRCGGGPFVAITSGGSAVADWFLHARHGSLFIDDVGALTADVQRQLLAQLDLRGLPSLTADGHPFASGVRILAGSSRHLGAARDSGAFSEPLFYRLNVIHVDLTSHRREECS
jgi:two-component system response regulator AtoC